MAPTSPSPGQPPVRRRHDLDRNDLAQLLTDQPRYRIDQIWDGWYRQGKDTAELQNVPKAVRERLDEVVPRSLDETVALTGDGGDTIKWLWSLSDGRAVESVLMHYTDRSTVCVSTQAGCAMACSFCATGQAGFERHLTAGEIVEQIVRAHRRAADDGRRLSNVVFMGMGEPLANYDAVWTAVHRAHDDLGISARRLTVSTVGVVPGIDRLAAADLPVNLAVSLHAATDELRDDIVPLNRRYPLAAVLEACHRYFDATGRRVSIEWALIPGLNDSAEQAEALAGFAIALAAHINVIAVNPTRGFTVTGSPEMAAARFVGALVALGANATQRRNRGTDIDAACGQLRDRHGGDSPPQPAPVNVRKR